MEVNDEKGKAIVATNNHSIKHFIQHESHLKQSDDGGEERGKAPSDKLI